MRAPRVFARMTAAINRFTRLTFGSRLRQAGFLQLDVLPRPPSATCGRVQTEADVVNVVDGAEIDGTADDEGPGGFLCAVVRSVARK